MVRRADLAGLIVLGAVWGGSFLFMRMGAGAFGGLALAGLRAVGAAVCFAPLFVSAHRRATWRRYFGPIAVVGVTNSALPFVLFAFAARVLPAGLSSIVDAAMPLFAALIGWLWLGERPSGRGVAGLFTGFGGVLVLIGGTVAATHVPGAGAALAAGIGATLLYGFSVHYARRRLADASPLVVAAGSQVVAAVLLGPLAAWAWPDQVPGIVPWLAALGLAVICTAFGYALFFRLIARTGPATATAALYLIPVFGVLWGALCLGERPTPAMLAGCVVIVAGTVLAGGQSGQPVRGYGVSTEVRSQSM